MAKTRPKGLKKDQDLILKAAATMAAALLAASVAAPGPAQACQKLSFCGSNACDCRAVGDLLVSDSTDDERVPARRAAIVL